jgi:hypothetical protein
MFVSERGVLMTDVIFVVVLIAFFAAFAGFVTLCERIIGPDPEGIALSTGPGPIVDEPDDQPEELAA